MKLQTTNERMMKFIVMYYTLLPTTNLRPWLVFKNQQMLALIIIIIKKNYCGFTFPNKNADITSLL